MMLPASLTHKQREKPLLTYTRSKSKAKDHQAMDYHVSDSELLSPGKTVQ